jgi:very-short-patch-repair endonuclease
MTTHERVPVTSPLRTLIDVAPALTARALEAAVNETDKLGLIGTDDVRAQLEHRNGTPGVRRLRDLLEGHARALTDSELERRFLRLVARAGLQAPTVGAMVSGYRADFFWPRLGLVVETDGLRYHRTPVQQARDRERDQAYSTAGLTPLRFTHAQVTREPARVVDTLRAVAARLSAHD